MNQKTTLISGCVLAAAAVGLGAFGAHALESSLSAEYEKTWNTASYYLMFNALALLILGSLQTKIPRLGRSNLVLFFASIIFSGSLYALILLNKPAIGAITPIGGSLLIFSWIYAAVIIAKHKDK